jgi:hypothetical protein
LARFWLVVADRRVDVARAHQRLCADFGSCHDCTRKEKRKKKKKKKRVFFFHFNFAFSACFVVD